MIVIFSSEAAVRRSSESESHLGFGIHGGFGGFGGFGHHHHHHHHHGYHHHGKREAEAVPAPHNSFGHSRGGYGKREAEVPALLYRINFLMSSTFENLVFSFPLDPFLPLHCQITIVLGK